MASAAGAFGGVWLTTSRTLRLDRERAERDFRRSLYQRMAEFAQCRETDLDMVVTAHPVWGQPAVRDFRVPEDLTAAVRIYTPFSVFLVWAALTHGITYMAAVLARNERIGSPQALDPNDHAVLLARLAIRGVMMATRSAISNPKRHRIGRPTRRIMAHVVALVTDAAQVTSPEEAAAIVPRLQRSLAWWREPVTRARDPKDFFRLGYDGSGGPS